jgi:DNA replication protein DnaC
MGRLLNIKTLAGFDFSFQPCVDRNRILTLAGLDFIDRHEVVHFLGHPGCGNTYLAIALAVGAVKAGRSVNFTTLAELIGSLAKAEREGSLRERIRFLCRPPLRGAMILTSNRGFAEWGEVFGDTVVATALLDRLLHHVIVVRIEGASYRLRRHANLLPDSTAARHIHQPEAAPRRRGSRPRHATPSSAARRRRQPNWGIFS